MLPEINTEVNTSTTITTINTIPSKTYKLNVATDDSLPYIIDSKNIVLFKLKNNHLFAYPQNPDCEIDFNIVNGHLIATSERQNLLDRYEIREYHMWFTSEAFGERAMGYVDKLDAIKQAIYHILMTERYAYLIYSNNYGVELEQYIGKEFSYLEATIESTLKEALTYDLRIKDIVVTSIENKGDHALVKFTVYSIYGDLQMEVNISV